MSLESSGFAFGKVEGLSPQPKMKYYSRNKDNGEIVEHILPADPYSLNHYRRRGFVLNPSDLSPAKGQADNYEI